MESRTGVSQVIPPIFYNDDVRVNLHTHQLIYHVYDNSTNTSIDNFVDWSLGQWEEINGGVCLYWVLNYDLPS